MTRREFTIGISTLSRPVSATCAVCEEIVSVGIGFNAVAASGPGAGHSPWLHDVCAERYRAGVSEQLAKLRDGWPDDHHAEFLIELILEGSADVTVDQESYDEAMKFVSLAYARSSMILFADEDEEEPPQPTPTALASGQIEQEIREEEARHGR